MNFLKRMRAKALCKKLGVESLKDAGERLAALDWVLSLFKMRVGAEDIEISAEGSSLTRARLTVWFES